MLRSISILSLLLLTADLGSTIAPAIPGSISSAHAAEATGQIRRVRVTEQGSDDELKTVVRVGAPTGDTVASVVLSVTDPETDKVVETVTLKEPVRARVIYTGTPPEGAKLSNLVVYPTLADDTDYAKDATEFKAGITFDEAGEAVTASFKLRARITARGELRVRVQNEDKDWDPSVLGALTTEDAEGEDVSMTRAEVRQSWVADGWPGPYEDDLIFRTSVRDGDGTEVDSLTQSISAPTAAIEPDFTKVKVSTTKKGVGRLTAWTTSPGSAASIDVELVDKDTGKVVMAKTDDAPVRSIRVFSSTQVEFDGDESAVDYAYLVLVDAIDNEGSITQYVVELEIPEMDGSKPGETYVAFGPESEPVGVIGLFADSSGLVFTAATEDTSIDSINVIFEEPFEGPAPLELELECALLGQADKWVQKADVALPESFTLTAQLLDGEGEELDEVSLSGTDDGETVTSAFDNPAFEATADAHISILGS